MFEVQFASNVVLCCLRCTIGKCIYGDGCSIANTTDSRRDHNKLGNRCAGLEQWVCSLKENKRPYGIDLGGLVRRKVLKTSRA